MLHRTNPFHWAALAVAVLGLALFVVVNCRGIFGWTGLGVFSIFIYLPSFILASIFWLAAQLRSQSRLRWLFWMIMFFPALFLILLPAKFYV